MSLKSRAHPKQTQGHCWFTVEPVSMDDGPILSQHWFKISCFLGNGTISWTMRVLWQHIIIKISVYFLFATFVITSQQFDEAKLIPSPSENSKIVIKLSMWLYVGLYCGACDIHACSSWYTNGQIISREIQRAWFVWEYNQIWEIEEIS